MFAISMETYSASSAAFSGYRAAVVRKGASVSEIEVTARYRSGAWGDRSLSDYGNCALTSATIKQMQREVLWYGGRLSEGWRWRVRLEAFVSVMPPRQTRPRECCKISCGLASPATVFT